MAGVAVIDKNEYEELIRDSEKLRCIEALAMNTDVPLYRNIVLCICGMVIGESEVEHATED